MRVWLCSVAILAAVLHHSTCLRVESLELRGLDTRFETCKQASKKDCQDIAGKSCEWCEQPAKCYPVDFAKSLGILCRGQQPLRQAVDLKECEDVEFESECMSMNACRWCRSEVLDDACFTSFEARKLPSQVFDCSHVA